MVLLVQWKLIKLPQFKTSFWDPSVPLSVLLCHRLDQKPSLPQPCGRKLLTTGPRRRPLAYHMPCSVVAALALCTGEQGVIGSPSVSKRPEYRTLSLSLSPADSVACQPRRRPKRYRTLVFSKLQQTIPIMTQVPDFHVRACMKRYVPPGSAHPFPKAWLKGPDDKAHNSFTLAFG